MNALTVCLGLLLLAGCGKDAVVQSAAPRLVYPALNESPPPPALSLPPSSATAGQPQAEPVGPPAEIKEDSAFQREIDKIDLANSLQEYAAKARPGDPFALTKREIEELSKCENPVIN